jgi:hypothetical protein
VGIKNSTGILALPPLLRNRQMLRNRQIEASMQGKANGG